MIWQAGCEAGLPSTFGGKIEAQIRLLNAVFGPLRRTIHAHQFSRARLRFLRGLGDEAGGFDLPGAVAECHGGVQRVGKASVCGVSSGRSSRTKDSCAAPTSPVVAVVCLRRHPGHKSAEKSKHPLYDASAVKNPQVP